MTCKHTKRHGFSSSPNAPAPVDGTFSSPFHVHVGPVDGPMPLADPWSDLMARDSRSENWKESSANHHHNEQLAVSTYVPFESSGITMSIYTTGYMVYLWKSYLLHGYIIPCSWLWKARSRVWGPSMLRYITVVNCHCDWPKTSQPEHKIHIPISFIVKLSLAPEYHWILEYHCVVHGLPASTRILRGSFH